MLFWSLLFLLLVLAVSLLDIAFTPARARISLPGFRRHTRWDWATSIPTGFRRVRMRALAAARAIRGSRFAKRQWQRGVLNLVVCSTVIITTLVSIGVYHVNFNRSDLPDVEALARFEFPTIGTVYDAAGLPLIELAKEYRKITRYKDIPPIVRDAIIAAEDKRFFSHSGVDYAIIPRLLSKIRMRAFGAGLTRMARGSGQSGAAAARRLDDHPTARARSFSQKPDGEGKQPPAAV